MKKITLTLFAALFLFSCTTENKSEKLQKKFDELSQQIKQEYAPDRRSETFETKLIVPEDKSSLVLKGSTTKLEAKTALLELLKENKIDVIDSMIMLPDTSLAGKTYGLTAQSVINFRYGSGYSNESATQTIMGMPVRILEKRGGWTRAVTPEGYIAWVSSGSIHPMTQEENSEWMASKKLIITTHYTLFRSAANDKAPVVSDGVWGNVVQLAGESGAYYKVILPSGKDAFVLKSHAQNFDTWLNSRVPSAQNIVDVAVQFLGFPYMWGGTSIKAMDCSGFTKTAFFLNGVIIPRDASQQALTGEDVVITDDFSNLQMGDLLFFGSKATAERKERITHVGIYLNNGQFIHSATSVRINSLFKDSDIYYDGSDRLVRVNRVIPHIDKDPGIVSIKNHPWYF